MAKVDIDCACIWLAKETVLAVNSFTCSGTECINRREYEPIGFEEYLEIKFNI